MHTVIGVMGPGEGASPEICRLAYDLGAAIATSGWTLLNGGRNVGTMDAAARGAHDHGGLTIGILPDSTRERASYYIDIPVLTGMGDGRNYLNVLSSQVVIALPGGAGTLSEIALALKIGRPVILLGFIDDELLQTYLERVHCFVAVDIAQAMALTKQLLRQTA
ncbi:MAG: hypothetical protein NVSMB42_11980 [Herpetosiphon sp.]